MVRRDDLGPTEAIPTEKTRFRTQVITSDTECLVDSVTLTGANSDKGSVIEEPSSSG